MEFRLTHLYHIPYSLSHPLPLKRDMRDSCKTLYIQGSRDIGSKISWIVMESLTDELSGTLGN